MDPYYYEDISTIGVEWENQSSVLSPSVGQSVQGDLDEEDFQADLEQYYKENELIVDGFKCPDEFINKITPMEFEEMVNLFNRFDVNRSGTIDKHETKMILHFLGMDFTLEKAEELLQLVDIDKSGEIDFEEFCEFIVLIKRGDERFSSFSSLIDKLHSSPLGELERQAMYRDLKTSFKIVDIREASLSQPTTYIVEVHLSGIWHNFENGEVKSEFKVRKFQGMGNTTREAKYNAASNAIINLGDSMPGVKYPPGEFPKDWLDWLDDNLFRGVEPGKIVSILASKGFHPHRNIRVMHRILAWNSLGHFLQSHPQVDLADDGIKINEEFLEWVRHTVEKGIDGEVLTELLHDRFIDLSKDHLLFAQKLRFNELGSLMGMNDQPAYILDFWHACRKGYLEDVIIYCKCGMQVNEEKVDRHTCERVRPLSYAAFGGHSEVIKVLISFGADVNAIDRRGRNAVHIAAMRGHKEACTVLIDKGGKLFAGDMQGNSALHLAAILNHYDVVDYLASRGQELTRLITSDKVRPLTNGTFDDLCKMIYEQLPPKMLTENETVRFEKIWLHEAAKMFVKLMNPEVRFMVPRSCHEIVQDVLNRFDPRPETGIFINDGVSQEQRFIKTIPSPNELSTLLKCVFRQGAIDSINNWHRTALHLACDANKVNSHEKIIFSLIDAYGCNVNLPDMHTRKALDLLIQDKKIRDMPTATQAREEVINMRREDELTKIFQQFAEEELTAMTLRRTSILQECIDREDMMDERLWHCTRTASIFKRRYDKLWEMYEDPDTGNYFYCKIPFKKLMGDKHTDYNWNIPDEAKLAVNRTDALTYLRIVKSKLLRKYGNWHVYRYKDTPLDYYYNVDTEVLQFFPPDEMTWEKILLLSTKTEEKLGYAYEWEVFLDQYQNKFYRNKISRHCEYDQPLDAVLVQPAEMLCTTYQYKNQSINQKWFSCEQCNRAWKMNSAELMMQRSNNQPSAEEGMAGVVTTAMSNSTLNKSLVLCEPCIARCHVGHKGVRFLYQARSSKTMYCMCIEISPITGIMCMACTISDTQLKTQEKAHSDRLERARIRQRNIDQPPIFACVPRLSRIGLEKTRSGWYICRVCPPLGRNKTMTGSVSRNIMDEDQTVDEDPSLLIEEKSSLFTHSIEETSDTESTYTTEDQSLRTSSMVKGDTFEEEKDFDDNDNEEEGEQGEIDEENPSRPEVSREGALVLNSQSFISRKTKSTIQTKTTSNHNITTNNNNNEPVQEELSVSTSVVRLVDNRNKKNPGLPNNLYPIDMYGWIEVYDVDEPEVLQHGDHVLVLRYTGIPRVTGRVKKLIKPGFYRIKYDEVTLGEETIERSHLEVINRSKFFFNVHSGSSSWARDELMNPPFQTESLQISGPDWFDLYRQSTMRRSFQDYDEMINPYIDLIYYLHHETFVLEKAVIRIQTIFRMKFHRPRPTLHYRSQAYTFDTPESVRVLKKEKAGWAYLRRRSKNLGEFNDVDGAEWEEYMDNKTAEYFYWQEENNLYQWEKPVLYMKNDSNQAAFKEGDEVMFRFPGRRNEEISIITKVRFDDETGEDMYDLVHKYVPDLAFRWIPRMQIKNVPMEGDALILAKLEIKWRNQLRRHREAEERRMIREREFRMMQELARLEELKSKAYRLRHGDTEMETAEGNISQATRLSRARIERIHLEDKIIKEEIDRNVGQKRRDKVQEQVQELRTTLGPRITRAEILALTRSLELKLVLEEKVEARNKIQIELQAKKQQTIDRIEFIESYLNKLEERMTTPKSQKRRKIIRRTHIAMSRQTDGFIICEWGCGDWFKVGVEQQDHQLRRCVKRIIPCTLGCPIKHTEEFWLSPHEDAEKPKTPKTPMTIMSASGGPRRKTVMEGSQVTGTTGTTGTTADTVKREGNMVLGVITNQQYHETDECPKRLVMCPLQCMEWVCAEVLDQHLVEFCTKRPAKPIECRLGCGALFGGRVETLIEAEDERLQHEQEECDYRIVRCNWKFDDGTSCAAQMKASERAAHRDFHLHALGVLNYGVPGVYTYRVPKNVNRMKVQLWGAGGGSGHFHNRQGGDGGGGAFIEAILDFEPFTVLELTVGSGGGAGVRGSEVEFMSLDDQRALAAEKKDIERHLPKGKTVSLDERNMIILDSQSGVTLGGSPGGGEGYGGGGTWACGGGGGYTSISKKTARGTFVLLLAAGGGGGGSLSGLPGGGLDGTLPGTLIDPLNGGTATVNKPGIAGDCGSTYNAAWPASPGQQWQGGNGCEFGAGGGGGYFGGGGGGTSPGIAGGGGGGSSYVYNKTVRDNVIVMGHGNLPGGLNHNPPLACGVGDWDKVGGPAGQGGKGDLNLTFPGNNGAIRLIKPGFY